MDFRTRIKELCQGQGITQKELAEKMGISPIAELFEKPNASNIIGFVKVGDTVHEVKSAEDVKNLAGKL